MEWTWDISRWEWMQHLAVWPLATLVIGIIGGFAWLSITDPTVPDDGSSPPQTAEAGKRGVSKHRA